jgi:hypothetical protein
MTTLDLGEHQIVEPVSEQDLAQALPAAELSALRRRFPPGSGEFLRSQSGDLVFRSRHGSKTVALPEIQGHVDRHIRGTGFQRKHNVDRVV